MIPICEFNSQNDQQFSHSIAEFDVVLHVFNADWHGIRAASGYAPGLKLAISDKTGLDGDAIRHIFGIIVKHKIKKVVFQGYSNTASTLCEAIHRIFGNSVEIYAVTHVTSAQFDNPFELQMLALLRSQKARRVIKRLGSVKPNFIDIVDNYWPRTILNFAPNIVAQPGQFHKLDSSVFISIENSWRKNLYTNIIAAQICDDVKTVYAVNFPTGLEKLTDLDKITMTPYRKGADLLGFMASMRVLMNASLAECQPMTQLEGFAVGTPCLTGKLNIAEFSDDPLTALCEVDILDNPRNVAIALGKLMRLASAENGEMTGMIADHLERRKFLATLSYAEFLSL